MPDVREKLVELLRSVPRQEEVSIGRGCGKSFARLGIIADHLIANGVTFETDRNVGSKWIPVAERLPENMDDRVLVLLPTKSYDYPIGNQHIDTDRYRGEYRKWVRYGDKVTHWMPLPEPPKEE